MIRALAQLEFVPKEGIRGGTGPARSAACLDPGDMAGVLGAGRTELAPGSSIGEHPHADSEELYLILAGQGLGILDGRQFPVAPGDLFVCKAGHSHGLVNTGTAPMAMFAVLTGA